MFDLETFWSNMLSGDPELIRAAWQALDNEEQAAVYAHLERMATEKEEWSEPQRLSAQAALDTIRGLLGTENF
jgi:hypothetical protein